MSMPPNPPGRSLAKNIQWPSGENAGTNSADAVLIVGAQIHRRSPGGARRGSLRDPDVVAAEAARSVGVEVEAQAVRGERGAGFAGRRVDDRPEVHRRRPVRVARRRGRTDAAIDDRERRQPRPEAGRRRDSRQARAPRTSASSRLSPQCSLRFAYCPASRLALPGRRAARLAQALISRASRRAAVRWRGVDAASRR